MTAHRYHVDPASGLIAPARQLASANFDERPAGVAADLIVVHNISLPPGQFGGNAIDDLFLNRIDAVAHPSFAELQGLTVSAHLLIRRDGSVTQYVPFGKRAWHAGRSHYQGRERCNDFSIGIELEGSDYVEFEAAQYEALAGVITALLHAYPTLSSRHITGHSDIAPGRKTDPGPYFDWSRLRAALRMDA